MSTISDVLARKGADVVTIPPDGTVLDAASLMNDRRIGAVCVVDAEESLVGVFTERDILTRVVGAQLDPATTKIADVMTTSLITCGTKGDTFDCAAVMSHSRIRHLPVVEDGRLIGMVSTGDILAMQATETQAIIEDLYQYLHGRT